jgi:hypothetical protein
MLMHTHIPPWIFILSVVYILPFIFIWGLWTLEFGFRISTKILIRFVLLYVIITVLMYLFFANVPAKIKESVYTFLSLAILLFYWGVIIFQLIRHSRKGQVLLHIHGSTANSILFCALFIIILITGGRELLDKFIFRNLFSFLLFVTLAAQLFIGNLYGIKITEFGLFYWGYLISWEKVKSYSWGGRNNSTLNLQLKRHFWKNLYFRIPLYQKDSVDAILSEKLPRIDTQPLYTPA